MTRGNSGPVDRRRNAVVALLVGCLLFGGLTALALLTDHPSHAVLFGSVGILVLALAIRELRAAPTAPAIGARAR
jgi:hypothetical protein